MQAVVVIIINNVNILVISFKVNERQVTTENSSLSVEVEWAARFAKNLILRSRNKLDGAP